MRIDKILYYSALIILLLDIIYFLLFNTDPLINNYSIIINSIILLFIALALYLQLNIGPIIRVLFFTYIYFFGFRILTLMIFFKSNILLNEAQVNSYDVTYSLMFIMIFTIILTIGSLLILDNKNIDYHNLRTVTIKFGNLISLNIFSFILLFLTIIEFIINMSRWNTNNGRSSLENIFYLFSTYQLLILLIPIWTLKWKNIKTSTKYIFITTLIIYIVSKILTGQRSAIANLVFIFITIIIFYYKNYNLNRKMIYSFLLTLIFSIIIIFPIATSVRYLNTSLINIILSKKVFDKLLYLSSAHLNMLFSNISLRLGFLDYAIISISKTKLPGINNYLNILFFIKSIIDRLLPGNIFNNVLPASRIFAVEYLGKTFNEARNYYLTQIYTIYGISYAYFGGWFSIIFGVSLIILINKLLYMISRIKNIYYYPVIISIITALWGIFFQNFGFDTIFVEMIYMNIGFYILLFANLFYNKYKRLILKRLQN